ncbi:hypothetical protein ES703_74592 [subsurface metagenome]
MEPDQLWWFREAHDIPNGVAPGWVSDLVPSGTIIHRVTVQVGIEPGGKPEHFAVFVFLTARAGVVIAEVVREQQIIWFHDKGSDMGYYPMCDDCEIQFPLRKTVVGSSLRFGIAMLNATNKVASGRVGILYSQP